MKRFWSFLRGKLTRSHRSTKAPRPSRLHVEELEPRILLANDFHLVEGSPGESVPLRFNWTVRDANFNNEVGVYIVQDEAGRVGGLSPADPGYAAAALASSQVLFAKGQGAGARRELTFSGGDRLAFFMVQNASLAQWQATNPQNQPGARPLAFFSVDTANVDAFDHVFSQRLGNGAWQFAWEDMTGGGDRDFNDLVFTVSVPGQQAVAVPGQAGWRASASSRACPNRA